MSARLAGMGCWWLLVLLQPGWHGVLQQGPAGMRLALTGLFLLPMLWPSWMLWRHRANGLFWAAVVSLLYFCHGVMEAWAAPAERLLALSEVALCLGLIGAVGVDGWHRRQVSKLVEDPERAPRDA